MSRPESKAGSWFCLGAGLFCLLSWSIWHAPEVLAMGFLGVAIGYVGLHE